MSRKIFYLTTPVYYVNAAPHIGHAYTTVLADALCRWQKLLGRSAFLATGTDEHGVKIERAAAAAKVDTVTFCNRNSQSFRNLFDALNVKYDDFIRTTEDRHSKAASQFWKKLTKNGHIYKGRYEGWYSVQDETFVAEKDTETALQNGQQVKISKESGHLVEFVKEDNYMFRLSAFREELRKRISSRQLEIKPERFERDVLNTLESDSACSDLSVSRPRRRVGWALPVPDDPDHSVYVWLDALVNYLTVCGYPDDHRRFDSLWPAVHLVGKDILKFHALHWPALLLAADLPLPSRILVHGHWLVDRLKMSKSRGNVVDPQREAEKFGADGLRYFLVKNGLPAGDNNYEPQLILQTLNNDLANTVGNLVRRVTSVAVNREQTFPREFDDQFDSLYTLVDRVDAYFDKFELHRAISCIMEELESLNRFIESSKPWELAKQTAPAKRAELTNVIGRSLETLRVCATLLQPVIPAVAGRLLDQLSIQPQERDAESCRSRLGNLPRTLKCEKSPLFPRIA